MKQLLDSAFVWSEELCKSRRVLSTSANNSLLDLHNSLAYPDAGAGGDADADNDHDIIWYIWVVVEGNLRT